MRGLWLFARTRRTATAVLVLLGLGLVERFLGQAALQLSGNNSFSVPWVVVVPLAAGTVIGTSTRSLAAHWELTSARNQAAYRIGHVIALFLLAAVATTWGAAPLTGPLTTPAALRNLVGFTGLALIAAVMLGGNLARTLPVVGGIATLTAGTNQGVPRGWAWPILANGDQRAVLIALALLAAGAAAIAVRRPTEPAGEAA